jgi:hypothetical protein
MIRRASVKLQQELPEVLLHLQAMCCYHSCPRRLMQEAKERESLEGYYFHYQWRCQDQHPLRLCLQLFLLLLPHLRVQMLHLHAKETCQQQMKKRFDPVVLM